MSRNPQADLVVQIVDENPDVRVQVIGDSTLEVSPADVGKIVVVQPDGTLGFTSDSGPVLTVDGQTGNVDVVEDAIVNGVIDKAPSQNAVFDALALKAPLASPTFTTGATSPSFTANGTGLSSRYRGATLAQPTALEVGASLVGDFAIDQTGILWICTVAGSPGTWRDASDKQLGYAQITTAPSNVTGLGAANKVAITGLSCSVTTRGHPIMAILSAGGVSNNTANDGVGFLLTEDGSTPTRGLLGSNTSAANNAITPVHFCSHEFTPTAGAHTYAVYWFVSIGGTGTLQCGDGTGTNARPASLRIIEASGT